MKLAGDTKIILAGAVAAAVALWWIGRKLANPGDTAAGIGAGIVSGVAGAASGVIGEAGNVAGDIVGLPRTSQTACEAAKASRNVGDIGLYCPLSEFVRYGIPDLPAALWNDAKRMVGGW